MIPHTCPVCNGHKTVSKPPGIVGDQETWLSSNVGDTYPCPACSETGIVWREEKMDEKIKEIEFDILPLNYLNPFKAKEHIQYLLSRISALESQIKEYEDATNNAQRDNSDEIHCSCVPLLKVRIKELEKDKESKDRIIDGYVDKKYELELRIKELESKEIGCKKFIEEFKNINPKLETRIKELEIEIKHSRNSYQLSFESTNKFYDDLQDALVQVDETEAERHRLSKLLIEGRVRIVELQEGIKEYLTMGDDGILYKLLKK